MYKSTGKKIKYTSLLQLPWQDRFQSQKYVQVFKIWWDLGGKGEVKEWNSPCLSFCGVVTLGLIARQSNNQEF